MVAALSSAEAAAAAAASEGWCEKATRLGEVIEVWLNWALSGDVCEEKTWEEESWEERVGGY